MKQMAKNRHAPRATETWSWDEIATITTEMRRVLDEIEECPPELPRIRFDLAREIAKIRAGKMVSLPGKQEVIDQSDDVPFFPAEEMVCPVNNHVYSTVHSFHVRRVGF